MADPIRPLVVGLGDRADGPPELSWAAREAQARHCPLHVVRATGAGLRAAAEQRVSGALDHVRACWPDVSVEGLVGDGMPVEVLRATGESAAVIVIGRGRSDVLDGAVLGSVSATLAAVLAGPVVAVSCAVDGSAGGDVVAGVDGSRPMPDVLEFAFDYARRHGCRLRVVYCWPKRLPGSLASEPEPPVPQHVRGWLTGLMDEWPGRYPDVVLRRSVVRGDPVAELVAASRSAELIVVGSRSRHPRVAGLLGSVSQGVLYHAACPVAVVHAGQGVATSRVSSTSRAV